MALGIVRGGDAAAGRDRLVTTVDLVTAFGGGWSATRLARR